MSDKSESLKDSYLSSNDQRSLEERRAHYFETGIGTPSEKMVSLSRFTSRQSCAKFIAQYEMIQMTQGILGNIMECGVYFGGGLMNWALISASLEPYNYQCQIIGMDTFAGSKGISDVDRKSENLSRKDGDYFAPSFNDLKEAISLYDSDRTLSHLVKVQLIEGDIRQSAPKYVEEHPELAVRIMHIGMNLYEPTRETLKAFLPRMSKGGIVAIDGLNYATGGCMEALREVTQKEKIALKVFDYYPNFAYFVV